jgi:intein/homing endonuclease
MATISGKKHSAKICSICGSKTTSMEQTEWGICFKPDTLIQGANKPISDVEIGDTVLGYDGSPTIVRKTCDRYYDGQMIKIKAKYLEPIECTFNHPIRVVKKEYFRFECGQKLRSQQAHELEWIAAKKIRPGDYLVVPRTNSSAEYPLTLSLAKYNSTDPHRRRGLLEFAIDEETAWIMGLYVAEGSTNIFQPGNIALVFSLHRNEFEYTSKLDDFSHRIGYKMSSYNKSESLGIQHRICCTALARCFKDIFGARAMEKHIPDFIFYSSQKIKSAFLRGLFDGDGYIKGNKIHLHTSSPLLKVQTQLLLASLGVMVGISECAARSSVIRADPVNAGVSWQLRGSSQQMSLIFQYDYQDYNIKHVEAFDDYILVPISHIQITDYRGKVHNIETENNTHLVSNAIVHNCSEHLC